MFGLKLILNKFKKLIDVLLIPSIIPAAFVLKIYRRIGSAKLPLNTFILNKIGVFPILNHYYEPLFIYKQPKKQRILKGINLNIASQKRFLKNLTYKNELLELNFLKSPVNDKFHLNNGGFEGGDADFLYQFIRAIKPKKIIEIGSGNSTKIVNLATIQNYESNQIKSKHICIEPFENLWLESIPNIKIIRNKLEDINLDWKKELKNGDLLFIDSSHMIRPDGDVLKEYLEILPSLSKGVYVHIHDIFTPNDYPTEWLKNDIKFWNEQYLFEALISNTSRYKIIAGLSYLKSNHFNLLREICPYLEKDSDPGSIYIQIQ